MAPSVLLTSSDDALSRRAVRDVISRLAALYPPEVVGNRAGCVVRVLADAILEEIARLPSRPCQADNRLAPLAARELRSPENLPATPAQLLPGADAPQALLSDDEASDGTLAAPAPVMGDVQSEPVDVALGDTRATMPAVPVPQWRFNCAPPDAVADPADPVRSALAGAAHAAIQLPRAAAALERPNAA